VNKDSVYRWIDKMGLLTHRLGRFIRFKLSKVDEAGKGWWRSGQTGKG